MDARLAEVFDVPAGRRDQCARLGEFIRLHRQRVEPEAAGMAPTSRRRTPGLRREELALLCHVSLTWVTWLEQGRDVAASAAVLARMALALKLSPAERAYLFDLAGRLDPASALQRSDVPAHAVLRSVEAMHCAAYVLDRRWDVVASNDQARELFLGWGMPARAEALDALDDARPNLLRFLFLHPPARELIHDWKARSWRLVAEFRADSGRLADTPLLSGLIEELCESSSDFARCWDTRDVLEREGGERLFQHPVKGALRYEQLTLHPAVRSDLKLVMLLDAA